MGYKIEEIEGIGPAFKDKLATAHVANTDDLLKLCGNPKGRKNVAAKTGLSEAHLLKWVNLADLMRISGIGPQFSELLEAAGVDTVKELRNRNAENLTSKMAEMNKMKKLTRGVASEKTVAGWIGQAKKLNTVISH